MHNSREVTLKDKRGAANNTTAPRNNLPHIIVYRVFLAYINAPILPSQT